MAKALGEEPGLVKAAADRGGEVGEPRALSAEQEEIMGRLRKDLDDFSSLDWGDILKLMQKLPPSPDLRSELIKLAGSYISRAFENGQFGNLEGIDPVLDFLEIRDVDFDPRKLDRITVLYSRYPLSFLYDMSPMLYDGKLANGEPYDKIKYTRWLLQKVGASPEELSDEYIAELWKFREILVRLHYKLRGKALPSAQRKLGSFVELLKS